MIWQHGSLLKVLRNSVTPDETVYAAQISVCHGLEATLCSKVQTTLV